MKINLRTDSKSIALLAVFSAMVAMLEVFPIVGITDLKFFPGGTPFTLDWTGIPIVIVFLGLGAVSSVLSISVMFIAIGYRNFTGAVFKGAAELLTIFGILLARVIVKKMSLGRWASIMLYVCFGAVFRAIGMYFFNIQFLPVFYPAFYTPEAAIIASTVLVPWNVIQAIINIVGGFILYQLIPKELKIEAGLGEFRPKSSMKYEEISTEEIDASDDEKQD